MKKIHQDLDLVIVFEVTDPSSHLNQLHDALEFWVVISGTISTVYYVVVEPLVQGWDHECVAKEFLVVFAGGGAPANSKRGRATPSKTRVFDCTMGYPGEDVAVQPRR